MKVCNVGPVEGPFRVCDLVVGDVIEGLELKLGGTTSLLLGMHACGKSCLMSILYSLPYLCTQCKRILETLCTETDCRFLTNVFGIVYRYAERSIEPSISFRFFSELTVPIPNQEKTVSLRSIELKNLSTFDNIECLGLLLISIAIVGIPEQVRMYILPLDRAKLSKIISSRIELLERERSLESLIEALCVLSILPRLPPYVSLFVLRNLCEEQNTYLGQVLDFEKLYTDIASDARDILGHEVELFEYVSMLSTGVSTVLWLITVPRLQLELYNFVKNLFEEYGYEISLPLHKPVLLFDEVALGLPLSIAKKAWKSVVNKYSEKLQKIMVSTHRYEVMELARPHEIIFFLRNATNTLETLRILRIDVEGVKAIRFDLRYLETIEGERIAEAIRSDTG